MEYRYYDSRGNSHSTAADAQAANDAKGILWATAIAAEEATRQREERERQIASQQSHNEEMERLESAKLEAQRQQMQYQKDLACLEGEPVATRAEYLVERALENAQMPFDEEAFDRHLNETFGEMAKPKLVELKAQAAKAWAVHQTAWQERCEREAEAAGIEREVERTSPQMKNQWLLLLWLLAAFACFCGLVLSLSQPDDSGLMFFKFSLTAIGLIATAGGAIRELFPKAERAEQKAHQQAQQELAKAWDRKDAAQAVEEDRKTELEKAECQVSEEVGRLKAKLIEHFHTKSYEDFIRAQQPLSSFVEFVWLQVSQFQEDLPPRCRVARDSITADLCKAHYPVLLDQAVSESVNRVKTARLDDEAHAAKQDADRGHQPPMNSCDPVYEQDSVLTQSPELSASEDESRLYLFGPELPANGYRVTSQGVGVFDALKRRTAQHPTLRTLGAMSGPKALWSLVRNGYVVVIRYMPDAFDGRYGDGIVVAAKEPVKFPDNLIRNFNLESLTPVFWFNGEKTKRMSFKEFNGEKLTKDEQAKWEEVEMFLSIDDDQPDVLTNPWNS